MGIKLHGFHTSTATRRVVAALHEKELDFEFVFVNLRAGSHKQPSFLSLNCLNRIQGNYKDIASAYEDSGTPLKYKDVKQAAILDVWMETEAVRVDISGSALAWELIYKNKVYSQPPDQAVVEENEAAFANVLDVYEARLAKSKYLAGDSFTLADLHHLPIVHLLLGTKEKMLFDERPHVSAWANDILARPSWQKTIAMWDQVYQWGD